MRKFLILAAIAFLSFSCTKYYTVSGNWPDAAGQTVSLHADDEEDTLLAEAVVAEDGSFKLKGEFEYEQRMDFFAGEKKCLTLFVDTDPIELSVESIEGKYGPTIKAVILNPSAEQNVLDEGVRVAMSYSLIHLAVPSGINKAIEQATSQAQIDSLLKGYDLAMQQAEDIVTEFVDTISNSIASVYTFESLLLKYRPIAEVQERYDNLSDRVKNSVLGQRLAKEIEVAATTAIGGTPADFTLQTPEGEDFNLYSLRGHYVILDFWASWCAPCRAEMPNVKNIYAKHHPDGLEILGVSLDENADSWKKCIEDMEIPWHHVSALKGWDCPVTAYFNVTGVPAMFILDPDGKIVAKDLRGEELANYIDELYK